MNFFQSVALSLTIHPITFKLSTNAEATMRTRRLWINHKQFRMKFLNFVIMRQHLFFIIFQRVKLGAHKLARGIESQHCTPHIRLCRTFCRACTAPVARETTTRSRRCLVSNSYLFKVKCKKSETTQSVTKHNVHIQAICAPFATRDGSRNALNISTFRAL